jgi:hypothetical protein
VNPFVELPLDDDEGLSAACKLSGLYLISRQHHVEEIVEIRRPPVDRRVRPHHRFLIELHDLEVEKGWRSRSPRVRGRRFCFIQVLRR